MIIYFHIIILSYVFIKNIWKYENMIILMFVLHIIFISIFTIIENEIRVDYLGFWGGFETISLANMGEVVILGGKTHTC